MIIDWNNTRIGRIDDPTLRAPVISWSPMPPEYFNAKVVDASTGEAVREVLCYDGYRKVIDRITPGHDGKAFLRADRDGVAVTTEFRELVITTTEVPAGVADDEL